MVKLCYHCKQTKPNEDFNRNKFEKDGMQRYCRECKKQYDRDYHIKNRNKRLKQISAVRRHSKRKVRDFLWEYLQTHPCIDCGEKDPIVLEFAHRNRATKKFGIMSASQHGAPLEKVKKEMRKCDVKCANCHRRSTCIETNSWRVQALQL